MYFRFLSFLFVTYNTIYSVITNKDLSTPPNHN